MIAMSTVIEMVKRFTAFYLANPADLMIMAATIIAILVLLLLATVCILVGLIVGWYSTRKKTQVAVAQASLLKRESAKWYTMKQLHQLDFSDVRAIWTLPRAGFADTHHDITVHLRPDCRLLRGRGERETWQVCQDCIEHGSRRIWFRLAGNGIAYE